MLPPTANTPKHKAPTLPPQVEKKKPPIEKASQTRSSGGAFHASFVPSLGGVPATQDGQHQLALRELQQWGHSLKQAEAIAAQPDYLRLHTLVFSQFAFTDGSFHWKPDAVHSHESHKQLLQVCQVWLERGDHAAGMPLLHIVLGRGELPVALWHALVSHLPEDLLKVLVNHPRGWPILAGIQLVASQDWILPKTPYHVKEVRRGAIENLVQATDRKAWAQLCLTTAEQRVRASASLRPAHVAKHLGRLIEAYGLLPPEQQGRALACAESLMKSCETKGHRADKVQRLREDLQRLRERHLLSSNQRLVKAMGPWLELALIDPTQTQPFQLDDQNGLLFNAAFLIRQPHRAVKAAQEHFQAWLRLHFNSPQGLPREQLFKVVDAVAGTPGSLEWSIHEVELERAVLALEAHASSTTCTRVYELLYLARKNKDIGVGPAQLARVVAMSRQPDISPTMRYQLLVAVCTLLPDPASQPELHRLWLQAVLARDADIDPDLRNSLLDESYHRHHPGALDDEPAATLLTHASVCWKQRLGKTTDALAQSFEQLSGRAHRPADNTHWQGWRVLAAHWLRELVERQNLNSSQHWAQLIQKVQQLAQAHASRPHEWVPRLTQLLGDLVELLPPKGRLAWLHTLEKTCRQQVAALDPASPALVSLSALCGVSRELIGAHGGAAGADPSAELEREIELLRQWSHVARLQEQGDETRARQHAGAVTEAWRQQAAHKPHAAVLAPVFEGLARTDSEQ